MDIFGILMLAMLIIFVFLLFYFVPVGMWIQGVVSLGLGRRSEECRVGNECRSRWPP